MSKNIELLLMEVHEKDVRDIVEDHILDIIFDEKKKKVTVLVDKRYVINLIQSLRYVSYFTTAIQKSFGEKVSIVLCISRPQHGHEREMLIPLMVHYGDTGGAGGAHE